MQPSALKQIHEFRKLRADRLSSVSSTNEQEIECIVDVRDEFYDGNSVKRLVVYLPSLGCEWAFWGAGCNMCGHYLSPGFSKGIIISLEEYTLHFSELTKDTSWTSYPVINLYNNGSFFNDREVPEHIREKILEKLSYCKKIKSSCRGIQT